MPPPKRHKATQSPSVQTDATDPSRHTSTAEPAKSTKSAKTTKSTKSVGHRDITSKSAQGKDARHPEQQLSERPRVQLRDPPFVVLEAKIRDFDMNELGDL